MTIRVLYVEDDPLLQRAVGRLLERAGLAIVCAADGEHALRILQSEAPAPDVIVLDLRMPRVDGWEFLRITREDAKLAAIPVVVTTGANHSGVLAAGVALVRKPFESEDLIRAIREAAAR